VTPVSIQLPNGSAFWRCRSESLPSTAAPNLSFFS
jgi:hypothetical protein